MPFLWGSFILLGGCFHSLEGQLIVEDDPSQVTKTSQILPADGRVNITQINAQNQSEDSNRFSKLKTYSVPVAADGQFVLEQELEDGEYLIEALVPGYTLSSVRFNTEKTDKVSLKIKKQSLPSTQTIKAHLSVPEGRGKGSVTLRPPEL